MIGSVSKWFNMPLAKCIIPSVRNIKKLIFNLNFQGVFTWKKRSIHSDSIYALIRLIDIAVIRLRHILFADIDSIVKEIALRIKWLF